MIGAQARIALGVFLLGVAACKSGPTAEEQAKENANLHKLVTSQQARLDQLTADRATLDRRVKELEAQLGKVSSAQQIVEEAKGEISESVRRVLEQFKGDKDIEVVRTGEGYRFVLREAVLFETGSTNLTEEGKRALGRVAGALRDGDERVSVEGHTDDVPIAKEETRKRFPRGNIELSVGRAFAVYDFLIKEGGMKESRVAVAGFGQHRPVAPNTSEMNRLRNRRVEIRVEAR